MPEPVTDADFSFTPPSSFRFVPVITCSNGGRSGTICSSGFDEVDAVVICRELRIEFNASNGE